MSSCRAWSYSHWSLPRCTHTLAMPSKAHTTAPATSACVTWPAEAAAASAAASATPPAQDRKANGLECCRVTAAKHSVQAICYPDMLHAFDRQDSLLHFAECATSWLALAHSRCVQVANSRAATLILVYTQVSTAAGVTYPSPLPRCGTKLRSLPIAHPPAAPPMVPREPLEPLLLLVRRSASRGSRSRPSVLSASNLAYRRPIASAVTCYTRGCEDTFSHYLLFCPARCADSTMLHQMGHDGHATDSTLAAPPLSC